jgi:hypothetical protein
VVEGGVATAARRVAAGVDGDEALRALPFKGLLRAVVRGLAERTIV